MGLSGSDKKKPLENITLKYIGALNNSLSRSQVRREYTVLIPANFSLPYKPPKVVSLYFFPGFKRGSKSCFILSTYNSYCLYPNSQIYCA